MDGFLDFLTREMEATFKNGKQVWAQEGNHEIKKKLVYDAVNRAIFLHSMAKKEMPLN